MLNKIRNIFSKGKPDQDGSERAAPETLSFEARMKHLENYFQRQVASNEAFIPEYEAAREINKIALKEDISESEIREIIGIFNDYNQKPHYNGSGWLDLRTHLEFLLIKKNMAYQRFANNNLALTEP